MKVKAGSWSMLSQEQKLMLLEVISNKARKPKAND
jgi:hypothetical protein